VKNSGRRGLYPRKNENAREKPQKRPEKCGFLRCGCEKPAKKPAGERLRAHVSKMEQRLK
jgi:hypothetical protein